ncbi:hypothetical protein HDU84_009662 [Entophlyctis sp. JEL0112]|nr:hypothetical protein HDU84_009662 [Entophlyctis sp. JEL0112]
MRNENSMDEVWQLLKSSSNSHLQMDREFLQSFVGHEHAEPLRSNLRLIVSEARNSAKELSLTQQLLHFRIAPSHVFGLANVIGLRLVTTSCELDPWDGTDGAQKLLDCGRIFFNHKAVRVVDAETGKEVECNGTSVGRIEADTDFVVMEFASSQQFVPLADTAAQNANGLVILKSTEQ